MPGKSDKEKLGALGKGMARQAGETIAKTKKKKRRRLDSIMGEIRKTRQGK